MINILIPLSRKSDFFKDENYTFPQPLIEIDNVTIIEMVIKNYETIIGDKRFIFVVNKEECDKFHIDNVLKLITNYECEIVILDGQTKGSVCSCLMAIEHINNDDELIIANGDQLFKIDLNSVVDKFREDKTDAGTICFKTIHPRWSFVLTDKNNKIIETSEKKPISKNAIAGFYYFKKGSYFVEASMKSIKRDASVNGSFYIAPIINEMVLENKNLNVFKMENSKFITLYSPERINEYKNKLKYSN